MSYKCKEDVRPQEGRQTDVFNVIAEQKADFILLTGGRSSGKTELITMVDLLFAGDPNFRSVKFRRTYKQLTRAGGLWQKANSQYKFFGAVPNKSDLKYTFPSGAETAFSYCDTMADAESWRGSELSLIAFDEINHHEWEQISMLQTCLRSQADMSSMMIGTCNPDEQSWVFQLFLKDYYIGEDGFPIEERNGDIRYYIIDPSTEKPVFSESLDFFEEHYPHIIRPVNPVTGVQMYVEPKRFCFFSLCIWDNPIAQILNPKYVAELVSLPPYKRDTQLYGNWLAKATKSKMFRREFLRGLGDHPEYGTENVTLPARRVTCRAWDLAYTEPSQANKYPDFTASIKMHKCSRGYYYLDGGWHPELHDSTKDDNDLKILGRFRKNVGIRDEYMLKQAYYDGKNCSVVLPKASAAGKAEYEQLKVMFVNEGFKVKGASTGNAANAKALRFSPFCSAAQQGLVFILKDTFKSAQTLELFLTELESMEEGFKSTSKIKDDWTDSVSDAFSTLQELKAVTPFTVPTIDSTTRLSQFRNGR